MSQWDLRRSGKCLRWPEYPCQLLTICGLFQARMSLSASFVEAERSSIADASSRSLERVSSKSSESAASTGITYGNGNGNSNTAVVGGAVGGALGAIVLGLIGVLLWRRKRGTSASSAGQQPFVSQQPSSQPITPASLTFSLNSNYIGGPPVTHAPQPGWHPQHLAPLTLSEGVPAAGQTSTASQQSASTPPTVKTWIERPPVIHQENYGGSGSQSLPAEASVNPRDLYRNAVRGVTHPAAAPMTVPYPASEASGGATSPAPAYSVNPTVSEKNGFL
jgi:hypothetical protein